MAALHVGLAVLYVAFAVQYGDGNDSDTAAYQQDPFLTTTYTPQYREGIAYENVVASVPSEKIANMLGPDKAPVCSDPMSPFCVNKPAMYARGSGTVSGVCVCVQSLFTEPLRGPSCFFNMHTFLTVLTD